MDKEDQLIALLDAVDKHLQRVFQGESLNPLVARDWLVDLSGALRKRLGPSQPRGDEVEVANGIIEEWIDAPDGFRGMVLVEEERNSLASAIASALHSAHREAIEQAAKVAESHIEHDECADLIADSIRALSVKDGRRCVK